MTKNSSFNQRVLWLLLLLAVECAQMSYGATVTYTVSSTTTVSKSLGKAPFGGTATYSQGAATAGQITKDNTSRLTLSDWGETSISNISLSMCSNASAGSGKLRYSTDGGTTWSYIVGSAEEGVAFNNSAWNGSYTTSYTNISKNVSITGDDDYDIIIEIVGTKNSLYCQSFTITHDGDICEIFDETFCASTGSNVDFGVSGSDGNGTLYTDNASWTVVSGGGAGGSAKFGANKTKGSATTPSISVTNGNDYTLKFFAAPWASASGATITISLTGGTIGGNSSVTTSSMTAGEWNYYEYTVRATSTSLTLSFSASINRFFLDDVCLCNAAVTCADPTALTKGTFSRTIFHRIYAFL